MSTVESIPLETISRVVGVDRKTIQQDIKADNADLDRVTELLITYDGERLRDIIRLGLVSFLNDTSETKQRAIDTIAAKLSHIRNLQDFGATLTLDEMARACDLPAPTRPQAKIIGQVLSSLAAQKGDEVIQGRKKYKTDTGKTQSFVVNSYPSKYLPVFRRLMEMYTK